MLSDQEIYQVAVTAEYGVSEGGITLNGLRAVEAAVRADCMTIEEHAALCGEMEALEEQLAAAQAVKEQIEDELNAAVMRHGYGATVPAMRIAELLTAAIVSEPSTPEQPEGENR